MDTLVLSSSYMVLGQVPWKRAIKDLLKGRAEVLATYADRFIHSFGGLFPMPSVIRFLSKTSGYFRRGVKFNRKNLWIRDQGACQYCGRKLSIKTFTLDHVTPESLGGKASWENLVVCCTPCNQHKANRRPEEAGMRLRRQPVKPKSLPSKDLFTLWGGDIPETWKDYLGSVSYWHGSLT
jgi:5-methylcytosine-specific restriction endonuclease McrA